MKKERTPTTFSFFKLFLFFVFVFVCFLGGEERREPEGLTTLINVCVGFCACGGACVCAVLRGGAASLILLYFPESVSGGFPLCSCE